MGKEVILLQVISASNVCEMALVYLVGLCNHIELDLKTNGEN